MSEAATNCERVRALFEGREAIYVEKGALRVRVGNIRCDIERCRIDAQVEELPTAGLERTVFHSFRGRTPGPLRWDIVAGYMTSFSDRGWSMGYGGWSLYFAPDVIEGVVRLASIWPESLDAAKRYERVLRFIHSGPAGRHVRVFPE